MVTDTKGVREEFERIAAQNGGVLLPEHVIDAAKDVNHMLHEYLWKDPAIFGDGQMYRARHLIMKVRIVEQTSEVHESVRVWHGLRDGYHHISAIVRSPDLLTRLRSQALSDLEAFRVKYAFFKESKNITRLLDELESELKEEVKGVSEERIEVENRNGHKQNRETRRGGRRNQGASNGQRNPARRRNQPVCAE